MLVVFDAEKGDRAWEVREFFRHHAIPAAAASPEQLKNLRPFCLIVTFPDQLDVIRHMPYDDIPALVYGEGFVNRALNAERVETPAALLEGVRQHFYRYFRLEQKDIYLGSGAFLAPGVYLSEEQLVVFGSSLELTDMELMIMKCLALSGGAFRSADQLAAYCDTSKLSNDRIRVHISNINKKAALHLPRPLVESRREKGYRFAYFAEKKGEGVPRRR